MFKIGKYDFTDQKRIIYGRDCGEAVAELIEERGAERVLVVSSKTLHRKLGATETLKKNLGSRLLDIYDDIEPHAPLNKVLKLTQTLSKLAPDIIVSIGGGSVIDTVKVASLANATNAKTLEDISALKVVVNDKGEQVSPVTPDRIIRQISIPTTLSGAEFGTIGGAVDTTLNVKNIYAHPQMCSESVIYDAELCRLTPNSIWTATAMRAVDHAVETILSPAATAYTDGPALHALKLFGHSLESGNQAAMSLQSIQNSQFAVWSATVGLMRTPYGASHGIGHQVGAIAGIQHGICSCIILPAVLRYNASAAGERDTWIAEALGFKGMSAADAVLNLVRGLGLPDSLSAAGVAREQLPEIASAALGSYFVNNNLQPINNVAQIMEILEMAWET